MRPFAFIVALIAILIGAYVIYIKATYIDEEIRTGSAYGFTVGQSKDAVFQTAKIAYSDKTVLIQYPLGPNGYGPLDDFKFDDDDYKKIADRNRWTFYFDDRMNFIRFKFNYDRLAYIYRHRQEIEAP